MKSAGILSIRAGAGHTDAGNALKSAFDADGRVPDVWHEDATDRSNALFAYMNTKFYLQMVEKAPQLWSMAYNHTDVPWRMEKSRIRLERLNLRPLTRSLRERNPELIVCTHFTPAEIVSSLKGEGRLKSKLAVVVTDLDAHALWLCRHYDQYFVALEETRTFLAQVGIDPRKVTVAGMPIDAKFAMHKDKAEMRSKYGLNTDRTTLLVTSGGHGVGPIQKIVDQLVLVDHPIQILVACGKSAQLKQAIDHQNESVYAKRGVLVKTFGWTRDVDELMSASDLMVGKPGGSYTAQGRAKGLAQVNVQPIPGQEEHNSLHLLEQNVAIRCDHLSLLAFKVNALLKEPGRLEFMQKNSLASAQPHAAQLIVDVCLSL